MKKQQNMKQPTKQVYTLLNRRKTSHLPKLTWCLLTLAFTACGRSAYYGSLITKHEIEPQVQNIAAPLQDEKIYYEDELFEMIEANKIKKIKKRFKKPCKRSTNNHWSTALNKESYTAIELTVLKGDQKIFDVFLKHIKERSCISHNLRKRPQEYFFLGQKYFYDFYSPAAIEDLAHPQERVSLNYLLYLAIEKNQAEMVQKILKKAKDYIDPYISKKLLFNTCYGGEAPTPLHQAVIKNNPKIIKIVAEALKPLLSDSNRNILNKPCRIGLIEESMLSLTFKNKDFASSLILLELGCRNFQGVFLEGIKETCDKIYQKKLSDLDKFESLILDYFLKDINILEYVLLPYFKTNFESFKSDPAFMQMRATILNYRNVHFLKLNGIDLPLPEETVGKIGSYLSTTDIKFNEQANKMRLFCSDCK